MTAILPIEDLIGLGDERDMAVLRALGRLEFMASRWLKDLFFPRVDRTTMFRRLSHLVKLGLIWYTQTAHADIAPARTGSRQRTLKLPYIYGLTPEGRNLLDALDLEPYAPSLAALRTRDRRAPDVPKAQLAHDLLAASWCVSMIDAARRCPMVDAIFCHVEYVSDPRQRIDAILVIRFNTQQRTQARSGWDIPWHDGSPDGPQHQTVRLALEVDRGTEPLKVLLGKGLMYRTLTAERVYHQTLGGPVLPVFLVPPGKRAAQIAREWQDAWPGGPGVISTPSKATHPVYGALWGEYLTLKDVPPQRANLLGSLVGSPDAWGSLVAAWVPELPERLTPAPVTGR
ncbi:MAG TPA: replication-relaxation family protein [Herpetosiphonaceae bacterium]